MPCCLFEKLHLMLCAAGGRRLQHCSHPGLHVRFLLRTRLRDDMSASPLAGWDPPVLGTRGDLRYNIHFQSGVCSAARFQMLASVRKATTSEWMSGTHGHRPFRRIRGQETCKRLRATCSKQDAPSLPFQACQPAGPVLSKVPECVDRA